MRNVSLVFLFVFISCSITLAQQKTVFKEDFEGYDNDWRLVNNKEFKVKQEEGKLAFSKANLNKVMNGCLWYKKTINNFYTDKNFIISFDANSISSEFNRAFDVQWGKLQEFDGVRKTSIYQLEFSMNKVRLAQLDRPKNWLYFKWSDELMDDSLSPFQLERGKFSKFEIIQENDLLLVKVNQKLVYKMPLKVLSGSEIGFQHCLKGEWELDNLIIKQ
ncbi:hypothetical protein EZ428_22060 [Pedobacter frigiditerrae]|uniref:Uncharacterized protein n=1 Tax=Pedobacter frigiditerrae TaxID=2530452 RepID=A0A4R0ML32_9SPHI|nr:hypothetical protein [Pedobacter frigiditerrae]TCC87385.1 hypothetical protein EZ428_22060 [Pedobacter frigiditerrae]